MRDTLTKRDWETISAYLDGQLSARKQARLESRLQHNQQLQIALEEMRNTRDVLHNAPRLRAPRSFMLTPEMAGQPHRLPRLAPIFGWASAVASFLFVIFIIGDLFTTGGAIPMALNNFPQEQQEFIAPKGEVAVNDTASQAPSDAGGMEASAQPMAEAPAPEIIQDEAALDVDASTEESAPVGEQAAAREVAPAETVDEPEAEEPPNEVVEVAEATPTQAGLPDTSVTFGAAPPEETPAPDGTAVVESDEGESHEPREGEGVLQVTSITETLPTETAAGKEPEAEEELEPAEKAAPTAFSTESIAEFQAEEPAVQEPTQEGDWGSAIEETKEKSSDYVIGIEAILALLAVATGFAWFYLRRRGG